MEKISAPQEALYQMLKQQKERGVIYQYLDQVDFNGREINMRGAKLRHFANCCYLGLEIDPRLKEGAVRAINGHGTLLSNSRAFFSSSLYSELEVLIDQMLPGHQVITTTTTLGHCSTLPALIDKDDVIIADLHAHNSMQMAAKQCVAAGTELVYLLKHNDMNRLQKLVNRPQYKKRRIWFLTDGVFSMQGEFLDIEGLKAVLNNTPNMYAYIDDAHGFSWKGKNGAGHVMEDGTIHPQIICAVSMCKSFGTFGGIITFPNEELKDRIGVVGQTQMFSAPIPPPMLGASIASAKIHLSSQLSDYQNDLKKLIAHFRNICDIERIPVKTKSITPIQFIEIGDNSAISAVNTELMNNGIFCSSACYPAMPKKHGGLRISLTRHLKTEDIDYLVYNLKKVLPQACEEPVRKTG